MTKLIARPALSYWPNIGRKILRNKISKAKLTPKRRTFCQVRRQIFFKPGPYHQIGKYKISPSQSKNNVLSILTKIFSVMKRNNNDFKFDLTSILYNTSLIFGNCFSSSLTKIVSSLKFNQSPFFHKGVTS